MYELKGNKMVNLPQSISVPKLGNHQYFFGGSNPSLGAMGIGAESVPKSAGAMTSGGQQMTSNEVKMRLKNVILQKLNRSGNSVASLMPTTPPAKSEMPMKHVLMNHHSFNHHQHHSAHFNHHQPSSHFFPPPSQHHHHHQMNFPAANRPFVTFKDMIAGKQSSGEDSERVEDDQMITGQLKPAQLQRALDEEEQSLRRTTSEPNLKVKSALKDRILGKQQRNMHNPFTITKRNDRLHQHQPHPYSSAGKAHHPTSPLVNVPHPMPPQSHLNPTIYPGQNSHISTSLGSLHHHYHHQRHHESGNNVDQNSIFAAAAAAAAAAVAAVEQQQKQRTPSPSQHQQQQQQNSAALAAAAAASLLSLSTSGRQRNNQTNSAAANPAAVNTEAIIKQLASIFQKDNKNLGKKYICFILNYQYFFLNCN